MIETLLRFLLPLYAVLTIAKLAAHRARIRKKSGHDPVVIRPFRKGGTHEHLVSVLFVALLALLLDVLLNAVAPQWISGRLGIPALRHAAPVRWAGFVAVTGGLFLSSVAVRNMGTSWRMGIDRDRPGSLVTHGLFSRMRHPIYAGMLLVASGMAAATADVLSVGVAVAAWVGLPIEARLEEDFLLSRYGDEYRQYVAHTGRFWPAPRR